jgi:Kef-type K+ transport system membrane component KefB
MDNVWFVSALWIGLALVAASMQAWVAISVALLEIIVGAVAGNLADMSLTPWINYLAGFGAILLTFLAGAEIDAKIIRRHFGATMAIGAVGFLRPISACSPGRISSPAGPGPRPRSPASRCRRPRSPSSMP